MGGVASLPLMSASFAEKNGTEEDNKSNSDNHDEDGENQLEAEETRDVKMLKMLQKAYLRNVDLLELYLERNIFSVAKRTKHFRQRIVEAFEKAQENDKNESSGETSESACTSSAPRNNGSETSKSSTAPESDLGIPTGPQDVPTPEMTAALEESIKSMRLKLEQVRKTRFERLKYCQNLEQAAAFSEESKDALAGVSLEQLPGAVKQMAEAREDFEELQRKGKDLVEKMDDEKKSRSLDEKENDKIILSQPQEKKTKLSLEEHYQENRNVLTDLAQVKKLLQHKP